MSIKWYIADPQDVAIQSIRARLSDEARLSFAGSTNKPRSDLPGIQLCNPDVLLLALNLPGDTAVEICRQVKKTCPHSQVLGMTTFNHTNSTQGIIQAGALGVVLKSAPKNVLLSAIISVATGKHYYDQELNRKPNLPLSAITKREKEVLQLIAEGLTNVEIANRLFLSTTTVDTHRKHLLFKMQAKNSAEMVKMAFQFKLLQLDE